MDIAELKAIAVGVLAEHTAPAYIDKDRCFCKCSRCVEVKSALAADDVVAFENRYRDSLVSIHDI